MTNDEQYAAIGKAHADLKAARERMRALSLRAHELGNDFSNLGQALQVRPEAVGINGESPMPINLVPPGHGQIFDRKLFNADEIKKLTADIRDTIMEIGRLENLLK